DDMLGLNLDNYQHEASFGYEYARSDSTLFFAGSPVTQTAYEQNVFLLGYSGTYRENDAILDFTLSSELSPGGLTSENDREAFEAARQFASPSYATIGARYNYSNFLWDSDVLFTLRGVGQLASTNLQSERQLPLTGAFAVRGFEDGEY
ncbi:ShlB/FhaC/HecB family hemolysin secretion/activation protein, partial [Tritonibacter sp. SIMBA_163]|uniref:ShlB/FhaC/HecB family hemolysin secretion/activation protein n=1 Tax=Tritonibacter sp. SIMBA_163 TaxID=3080868 RepID=UPI00398134CF